MINWISQDAFEWLIKNINPSMRVFEYGSGESTLFFKDKIKELISIEHNPQQYGVYNTKLKSLKTIIDYKLIEPIQVKECYPYSHISYGSFLNHYTHYNFENYVNYINNFPDEYFNLIFINGRSRASCISKTYHKIKKGGFFILNDSQKFEYKDAIDTFLKNYEKHEYRDKYRQTTIWWYVK